MSAPKWGGVPRSFVSRPSIRSISLPRLPRGVQGLQAALLWTTRAEQALRAALQRNEQQSRLCDGVASTTPDFVYIFDREGRFLYANHRLLEVWGMELPDVVGKTCSELGYEQWHHDMHMREIAEVIETKRALKGEVPFKAPLTGIFGVYEYIFTPVLGPDGGVEIIAATTRDVTERKQAEQALRDSERQYRALFESMQEGFVVGEVVTDEAGNPADWRYLQVNDAILPMLQKRRDQVVGHTYRELYPNADWKFWVEGFGRVALTGQPARLEDHGSGTERDYQAIVYSPGLRKFAAVLTDVTERKRAEEELRRAKETNESHLAKLEAILGSMTDGLAVGDLDGNIVDLNPAALAMHGFSRVDEARRHISECPELFDVLDLQGKPVPTHEWALARATRGETFANQELRVRRKDTGKEFIGNYSGTLVRDASGRGLLPIVTVRDVTEQKRAAEALQRVQKMESIGLLAGGVAHDFNNLLTVIMGSASAALDQCPSCGHSQAIIAAAERAASLTKQLLAYAGKGQFVRRHIDVSALVSQSKHLLESSVPKRVNLTFNLADDLPAVEEDPSRFEQILMNLVINAGEAIPAKTDGRIVVGTGRSDITPEEAQQQVRYEVAPGEHVWLDVRDNGVGMEEATLSQIFDPFFSTKFTGRGLGLAAVDGIVRSSKGFINVRTCPGGGTAFRVFLPASGQERAADVEAPVERRSRRGASTILVVDDEEMVRKLATMILRRHGYDVLEATDGKHSLQVLADAPLLPSAVLLDLAMPVLGGDELVPILTEQYPSVKIIISSGFPEDEARNGFRGTAVAGFLQKPYTAVTLTNKIDEILGAGG